MSNIPLMRIPTNEHVENYLSKLSASADDIEIARNGIEQYGFIKGLLSMLQKGEVSESSQAITLDTIAEVARNDFFRQLQLSSGLPEIVNTMSYSSSPRVKQASVIAVSALCENNEQTIKQLLKTKALNEVVAWIQQSTSPDLLRLGCLFIESLCNNEKRADVQTAFQRKGALSIITDQLKVQSNNELVVCGLCLAGAALVKNIHDENQRKFRRLKVIPMLIGLLAENRTRQMQIETITSFILELVRGCEKNCKRFFTNGLIPVLLDMIVMEATPLTLFNCQGIIWFCTRSDTPIRDAFLEQGLVAKLKALTEYTHPKIQTGIEKILKELNLPLQSSK